VNLEYLLLCSLTLKEDVMSSEAFLNYGESLELAFLLAGPYFPAEIVEVSKKIEDRHNTGQFHFSAGNTDKFLARETVEMLEMRDYLYAQWVRGKIK
jgi:hypothetical protein